MAERVLGKDEVTSSILVIGSSLRSPESAAQNLAAAAKAKLRLAGQTGDLSTGVSAQPSEGGTTFE